LDEGSSSDFQGFVQIRKVDQSSVNNLEGSFGDMVTNRLNQIAENVQVKVMNVNALAKESVEFVQGNDSFFVGHVLSGCVMEIDGNFFSDFLEAFSDTKAQSVVVEDNGVDGTSNEFGDEFFRIETNKSVGVSGEDFSVASFKKHVDGIRNEFSSQVVISFIVDLANADSNELEDFGIMGSEVRFNVGSILHFMDNILLDFSEGGSAFIILMEETGSLEESKWRVLEVKSSDQFEDFVFSSNQSFDAFKTVINFIGVLVIGSSETLVKLNRVKSCLSRKSNDSKEKDSFHSEIVKTLSDF